MSPMTCAKCGKQRHPRLFRHKVAQRRPNGSVRVVGKTTSECRYCYEDRLSRAGEFTLAHHAKLGKLNFVLANERRQRREAKRRQKISRAVSVRWRRAYGQALYAHPVAKELRRVEAALRKFGRNADTVSAKTFLRDYCAQLATLHKHLQDNPRLIENPKPDTERQILHVQEEAKRAWATLTPEDRGYLKSPQRITNEGVKQ